MGKTRLNTRSFNKATNAAEYQNISEDQLRSKINDTTKFSEKEIEALNYQLEVDLARERALKQLEEDERRKQQAIESAKNIEANTVLDDLIDGVGEFFSGAFDSELENFHITKNGKVLKRRTDNQWSLKRNFSSNPFNPLGGINDDGTFNKELWQEATPQEYAKAINSRAKKRASSDAFNAGDDVSNFTNTLIKTGLTDAISGISKAFNNNLKTNALGAKNFFMGINQGAIDVELTALEKLGLKETNYYRTLEEKRKQNLSLLAEDANKLKEYQAQRAEEIKIEGNNTISEAMDNLFALEQRDELFNAQKNIRNLVTQKALEIEGREKPELLDENKIELDTSTVKLNGTDIPLERLTDSGSKWDAEKLVLKPDGTPMTDSQGNPIYDSKYSFLDKVLGANLWNSTFDKYGHETVTDAVASSVGFLVGGKGIGATVGSGVKLGGKTLGALGKIGNASEKALRMLERTTGAIDDLVLSKTGSAINSGASLARGANAFNMAAQSTLNSYLMTNAESQGVGNEAAKTVYNNKIDSELGVNKTELMSQLTEQYPEIDTAELEIRTEMEMNKLRDDFRKANPERHADILAESLAAKEVAASLNNLNTLFNLNFGAAFVKGKSLSRSLVDNPYSAKSILKTGYNVAGEGVQEYFEEGLFNSYSQKVAESNANGKAISIYDYFNNEFLSKENVTSGLVGLLSGMGQSFVMENIQKFGERKTYLKQQEQIKDFRKLLEADSETLPSYLNLLADSADMLEYNMKTEALTNEIKQLESEGKTPEADAKRGELQGLSDSLFVNKAIRAATSGTSGALNDILEEMMQNDQFSNEDKFDIEKAIELNNTIADTYDKYHYFAGAGKITENRINKFLVKNQLDRFVQKNAQRVLDDYNLALDLEASKAFGTVNPSNAEDGAAYDQFKSRFVLDPLTNKAAEEKLQYDNFVEKGTKLVNDLDSQFNYLTSRKGQQELLEAKQEAVREIAKEKVSKDNVEEVKAEIVTNTQEETKLPESITEVENLAHQELVTTPVVSEPVWKQATLVGNENIVATPSNTVTNISESVKAVTDENTKESSSEEMVNLESIFGEENNTKDDFIDLSSLSSDNTNDPLFSFVIKFDNGNEKHNQIVDTFAKAIQKDLASTPHLPLDGVIARLGLDHGLYTVGQNFDLLMEAWGKATGTTLSTTERDKIFNNYFGYNDLSSAFGNALNITHPGNDVNSGNPVKVSTVGNQVDVTPEAQLTKELATPEVAEGVNTNPVETLVNQKVSEVRIDNMLNDSSDPKFAFLGLEYEVSEDGQSYTTKSTDILESAKKFLDYRNFKPGDSVDLTFNFEYLYNPKNTVRVWFVDPQDGLTKGELISVEDRIKSIFPNMSFPEFVRVLKETPRDLLSNDEFLKMIPVGIIYDGEVVEGGLNDYDWWNPRNVAPAVNPETGEKIDHSENLIIIDGQRKNLEIRESILNSENFSANVVITGNSSAHYNTLLLETEEEKEQGYSNKFNSILSAFNNDEQYLSENVGFAFFADGNIVNNKKGASQPTLVIGGKEVQTNQIENLAQLKESIQNAAALRNENSDTVIRNPESGMRVIVHKSGMKDGKPTYTANLLITNHKTQQQTFSKINNILDTIMAPNTREGFKPSYAWMLKNRKDANALSQFGVTEQDLIVAEKVKKVLQDKFGIDITSQNDFKHFKDFYPERNPNNKNEFTQNISVKARAKKNGVPDIIDLAITTNSVKEAIDKIVTGNIGATTPDMIYARTMHTQYVFTPIEKNGEIHYTNLAQRKITFSLTSQESPSSSIDIINKTLEDAKAQLNFLEMGMQDTPSEALQEQVEKAKEVVKNLEEKVEQEKVSQVTTPVVTPTPTVEEVTPEPVQEIQEEVPVETVEEQDVPFNESDINDINNEVFFRALSKIDINDFNRQSIINQTYAVFDEITSELKSKGMLAEAFFMENNRDEILGIGSYDGSVKELIDVTFDITPEISEESIDEVDSENPSLTSENVKDYSKEGFQQDIKASLGMKVKAILSGIKDTRYTEKGFGGFDKTIPLNDVLDFLQQALAQSENNTLESLTKTVGLKQKYNPKDFGFYSEIMKRISDPALVESGVTNEILYNLYQSQLRMDFLMYNIKSDGTFSAQVYDANSKSPDIVKRRKWNENFKVSDLVDKYEEGYYRIREDKAQEIFNLHEQLMEGNKEGATIDSLLLEELLSKFGIQLNSMTIPALLNDTFGIPGINLSKEGFMMSEKGLVNNLISNLKKAIKNQNEGKRLTFSPNYVEDIKKDINFNLLSDDNSRLNTLVSFDNSMSAISMTSIYVGGKIVNAFTKPNLISNITKKLKGNQYLSYNQDANTKQYVEQNILATPITKDSLIAEMLKNDPRFKQYFDVVNISLEALKERGSKSRTDREITALSDKDSFVTLLNLFTSIEGEIVNEEYEDEYGVKFRRGIMSFPTLSDSSQMPLIKTALVDLTKDNFEDNSLEKLSDGTLNLLSKHLAYPSMRRMFNYYKAISNGKPINIDGHNVGAKFFTELPSLNFLPLTVNIDGKDYTMGAAEVFKTFIDKYSNEDEAINDFMNSYKDEIFAEVQRNIDHEVNQYISPDGTVGSLIRDGLYNNEDGIKMVDKAYLDKASKNPGSKLGQARLLMYDYVVNYMISQKEIQTLFAGDIANYFKEGIGRDLEKNKNSFKVTEGDIINFYYNTPEAKTRINELKKANDFQSLAQEFPYLQGSVELFPLFDSAERTALNLPIQTKKMNKAMNVVQNNLSKRLKAILSPGSQLPNSFDATQQYLQVMVQDVESLSEVILSLAELKYPGLSKDVDFLQKVKTFKAIDEKYEDQRSDSEKATHKEILKEIGKKYPQLKAFFKNAVTDAQEYTSWRENLNQLRAQGRITENDYNNFEKLLEDQTKNGVNDNNRLSQKDMQKLVMQTSKPLHAGLYYREQNGYNYQHFVYVKSSSFPLLPQLTESFPKLDALRKNVERMQTKDIPVRVSYETANKVGSVRGGGVSLSKLFNPNLSNEELDFIQTNYAVKLDRANFSIQQDKPFKSDKNAKAGKQDRVNRATQFEKIILGDGISKITDQVFPNKFSSEILNELGITPTDGKISGVELQKVYNDLYRREQKLLKNKLFRELGIEKTSDMFTGKPESMERLVKLLNKRLNNKQDRKALELLYIGRNANGEVQRGSKKDLLAGGFDDIVKAEFKIPIWMTPNSRKFESVLNSLVNKSLINLKLPGFSSPVASQQGFDIKGYEESTEYKGLITTPNFDPKVGLKATVDGDGNLKHAQVFMASKFKILNKETNQYEYVDLTKYVDENNILDTSRIPEDLLQLFSFRIPTSAHQSGVIVEVAGFLPHSVGDMMVVPKDHVTQIGEDFDIDVRYMYQLNYDIQPDGSLKPTDFNDYTLPRTAEEIKQEYEDFKNQLFNEFFNTTVNDGDVQTSLKNDYWLANKEKLWEIHFLEMSLAELEIAPNFIQDINNLFGTSFNSELLEDLQEENANINSEAIKNRIKELRDELIPKDLVKSRATQLINEYKTVSKELNKAFQREKKEAIRLAKNVSLVVNKEKNDLQAVENNIIGVYKSVFSTPDSRVRNLVNNVLSTDFAEGTVNEMDAKKASEESNIFNIFSPHNQRKIMKLGADGKMGIGVHSNAVTMNSILQQSQEKLFFYNLIETEDGFVKEPVKYRLGKLVFDGNLGQLTKNGKRISSSVMESQNSSTDNQKLQIMGRRNENKHTINVFSILQATGNDFDNTVINDTEMSYASLFIDQPIIRDYVALMEDINSSTSENKFMTSEEIRNKMFEKWGKAIPKEMLEKDNDGNLTTYLTSDAVDTLSPQIDGKYLYNSLLEKDADSAQQWYMFDTFMKIKGLATHYNRLQRIINIENGGLGISYFDTIEMMNELQSLFRGEIQIQNSQKLLGETKYISEKSTAFIRKVDGTVDKVKFTIEDGLQIMEDGRWLEDYLMELAGEIEEVRYQTTPEDIAEKEAEIKELESMGYIRVQLNGQSSYYMVKPENHYAHKIVNSITTGYELWNSIFPYDHAVISSVINEVIANSKRLNSSEMQDLKYQAISEMKDYIYSNAIDLFDNNSENYRQSLFFDTPGNESLASYLLKLSEHPSYKNKLFNQNFFKDLVFEVNTDTFPSVIKYNTSDVSKSYNLSIYNIFSKLMNSKTELPNYNGKPYNYELLMKDLLRYSLLADQGNGAIGFRHLLPMELFDKYNVTDRVKQQTDLQNTVIQTLVFNGVENAVHKFFGSALEVNKVVKNTNNIPFQKVSAFVKQVNNKYKRQYGIDNAISIVNQLGDVRFNVSTDNYDKGSFTKQFFQHNPELLTSLGTIRKGIMGTTTSGKIGEILKLNGIPKNFDMGRIAELHVPTKQFSGKFFTIKDSANRVIIFENQGNEIFKPIPTLGVFGLNEYNVGVNKDHSVIGKNNRTPDLSGTIIPEATFKYVQNTTLGNMVKDFIDNGSPYQATFQFLSPFVNLQDMKIQVVKNSSDIYYQNGQIFMGEEFLKADLTKQEFQAKILEELIHKLTVENLSKYFTFEGLNADGTLDIKYTEEEMPKEVEDLLVLYQEAVDYAVNKYGIEDVLRAARTGHILTIDPNDDVKKQIDKATSLYRISNFHEFIAGMFLRDEPLARELATVKSKKTGYDLLKEYSSKVLRMIYSVANVFRTNKESINAKVIENFHNFLEKNVEKVKIIQEPQALPDSNTFKTALNILQDEVPLDITNIPNTPLPPSAEFANAEFVSMDNLFGEEQKGDITTGAVEDEMVDLNTLFNSSEEVPTIKPTTQPVPVSKDLRKVEIGEPRIYGKPFTAVVAIEPMDNSITRTELTMMKVPGFDSNFGVKIQGNMAFIYNDSIEKDPGVEYQFMFKVQKDENGKFGEAIQNALQQVLKAKPDSPKLKMAVLGKDNLSNFENINLC